MIIDIHAHVCAAPELYQWKSVLMSARGAHGFAPKKFSDEWVRDHPDTKRYSQHLISEESLAVLSLINSLDQAAKPSLSRFRDTVSDFSGDLSCHINPKNRK